MQRNDGATVYLANLGPISVHTARRPPSPRTCSRQAASKPSATTATPTPSAAAAFAASGADIACICSSDDVYADLAEATAAALKEAGAKRVYLAGKGDYPSVDEYVYLGANALDILTRVEA